MGNCCNPSGGVSMKPLQRDCERYCSDYPTCTLKHCNRKKGFTHKGVMIMFESNVAIKLDYYMRKELFREMRETHDNGRSFTRPKYR